MPLAELPNQFLSGAGTVIELMQSRKTANQLLRKLSRFYKSIRGIMTPITVFITLI
jgi:hypothetical protein